MLIHTQPLKKHNPKRIAPSYNKIIIEGRLKCPKCINDHHSSRIFKTTQALFYHLTHNHSGQGDVISLEFYNTRTIKYTLQKFLIAKSILDKKIVQPLVIDPKAPSKLYLLDSEFYSKLSNHILDVFSYKLLTLAVNKKYAKKYLKLKAFQVFFNRAINLHIKALRINIQNKKDLNADGNKISEIKKLF